MLKPTPNELHDALPSRWAEVGYRRVSVTDDCVSDKALAFAVFYSSLAAATPAGIGPPPWSSFDILDAPLRTIGHLAVAEPVFRNDTDLEPDHFVYSLQGRVYDLLLKCSLVGRKVGFSDQLNCRCAVVPEWRDAFATNFPVWGHAMADFEDHPSLGFTRGVFPFRDAKGRAEKLVLYVEEVQYLPEAANSDTALG